MAHQNQNKPSFPLPVRIIALVMTFLVASGVLVYLVSFLLSLLGIQSAGPFV